MAFGSTDHRGSEERRPKRLTRPPALRRGQTIGICTPSFPAHVHFRAKYLHGLQVLRGLGYEVIEGSLTRRGVAEGYRSGSPRERAAELQELFERADVHAILATIGGSNSSSLIPYLDFDRIRNNPKIFCGYSDVTSLHLALMSYAGLSTFYGPAVVPSFGDWPTILPETLESFHSAVSGAVEQYELQAPPRFSRHVRDARTDAWRTEPRAFLENDGPTAVQVGVAEAPALVANLNTLVTAAGTSYFPDVRGRLLFLEEMAAPLSEEERDLRHVQLLGVFDEIAGLVISKPESARDEGAPFTYIDLIREIVPHRPGIPVVMDFDMGHTMPMHTLAQGTRVRVESSADARPRIHVLEPMVISS